MQGLEHEKSPDDEHQGLEGGCEASGGVFCVNWCQMCPDKRSGHLDQPPDSLGKSHVSPGWQVVEWQHGRVLEGSKAGTGFSPSQDLGAWQDLAVWSADGVAEPLDGES